MGIFEPDEVITIYSLRRAIEDGVLIEVFKGEWDELSGGKPIVASMNVYDGVRPEELVEVWNRFVFWRKFILAKLPEKKMAFSTDIDYHTIWVIDDRVCFTIMYPED
jgi:hypothetical protein